jgi:hypothetical protein
MFLLYVDTIPSALPVANLGNTLEWSQVLRKGFTAQNLDISFLVLTYGLLCIDSPVNIALGISWQGHTLLLDDFKPR